MSEQPRASTSIGPCIYCPSTIPPKKREHVMSQALGTFEQNWTLTCVCDECNGYFSKYLELALGRDSLEGILRIDAGVKEPESINRFLNKRATFSLADPGYFEGAKVKMRARDGDIVPVPGPQVGLRSPGGEWKFYFEHELTPQVVTQLTGPSVEIKVFGLDSDGDLSRLVGRLNDLGLPFTESGRKMNEPISTGSSIGVNHDFKIDATLRRAAAKIGFNYLAKALGPEVARRFDFDAIRRFIRHGEEPEQLVTAQRRSVLIGPDSESSQTHACMFGWDSSRRELIGVVTFFNHMTYGIRLCSSETDEWVGVESAHLFDPVARKIQAIGWESR